MRRANGARPGALRLPQVRHRAYRGVALGRLVVARAGRIQCLGQCRRVPLEAIYTDARGQLWGLCGRRRCADAYNGVEARADVRAALDVRAAESKPAAKANPFAALLRGRANRGS